LDQTAHSEKAVSLQQKELPDLPGKEGLMVTVEVAPSERIPKHRHASDVFVYVLSGTIVTQVQGQPAKTLHPGETFVEAPADIHLQSRNPSRTTPTRLLVFFVKDKGIPPTVYLQTQGSFHRGDSNLPSALQGKTATATSVCDRASHRPFALTLYLNDCSLRTRDPLKNCITSGRTNDLFGNNCTPLLPKHCAMLCHELKVTHATRSEQDGVQIPLTEQT